jgi:hypothetical protein
MEITPKPNALTFPPMTEEPKVLQTQVIDAPRPGLPTPPPVKVEQPRPAPQGPAIPAPSAFTPPMKDEIKLSPPLPPTPPPVEPKQTYEAAPAPASPMKDLAVKPAIGTDHPRLTTAPMPSPAIVQPTPIKTKTSPWSLHVEIVDDLTIVTATVNKKHGFTIVCQNLELQTGKDSLKASGKVKISGDAMNGSCDRLAISLIDDRLVLEGTAEVQIQKTITTVSSDDSRPVGFELKGETLNLRVSELGSGKFLQASWRKADGDFKLDRTLASAPIAGSKQWSPYGKLLKIRATNDGPSAYWLEDSNGTMIHQLIISEGNTLQQYVGRTISVYGLNVGNNIVQVSHIALP